tara:strand:+ start:547 stop:1317 length:771 start_codon:yes stop_codon:yes gene_type:complete
MSNIFLFNRFNKGNNIKWKGTNETNKNNFSSAQLPINQQPDMTLQLPRTPFKANPLKLYRKGRTINLVKSSKPSLHIQDIPNSFSIRNDNTLCNDESCAVISSMDYLGNKNLKSNNPTCDCIRNQPHHSKKLLQHKTILDKKYYTRHEDMRKARGQTFQDNLLTHPDANGTFKSKCNDELSSCPVIFKPNNSKYSVQGAVDAGTRIERLKLEAIRKNASTIKDNNLQSYNYKGANTISYSDKNKLNVPTEFRRKRV